MIKCSHLFNVLDARGAISVSERVGYIARVRKLARTAALAYVTKREELGFPMLPEAERAAWLAAKAESDAKAAAKAAAKASGGKGASGGASAPAGAKGAAA